MWDRGKAYEETREEGEFRDKYSIRLATRLRCLTIGRTHLFFQFICVRLV